jgi:osmotically-inducible protein OsmY
MAQRYDERLVGPFKRGPRGYQRSDERLKEDISERLMQSEHVDSSDVTVNVVAGKVTLEGTVPSRYMKHDIEDLADGCPGVQDIENKIRVS